MEGYSNNEDALSRYAKVWLNAMGRCSTGLVTMWACSKGEFAGEYSSPNTNAGGYFTTALINAAMVWGRDVRKNLDKVYMTDETFRDAINLIPDNQQNPQYDPHDFSLAYPFAVQAKVSLL